MTAASDIARSTRNVFRGVSTLVAALTVAVGVGDTLPARAATATPHASQVDVRNGKLLFEGWGWPACYVPDQCISSTQPAYDIWSVEPDGTGLTNLTRSPGVDADGEWSPDGSKIVFNSNRNGSYDIFVMDADGSDVQQLTNDPASETYATWSPSGRRIAYVDDSRRNTHIVIMRADGKTLRRIKTFPSIWGLAWSPQGRHMAFSRTIEKDPSKTTGEDQFDVYVMRTDGTGIRKLTSRYEGLWSEAPNWSPDGRRLVFDGGFDPEVCDRPGCDKWSIFTIRRDGRDLRQIASNGRWLFAAEWSPDGTTIAYTSDDGDPGSEGDIWFVDSDGKNLRHGIVKPDTYDYGVDWQSVPGQ